MLPERLRWTAYGLVSVARMVTSPAGPTRTSRWRPFSTTSSDPPGSTSTDVGQTNVSGAGSAAAEAATATAAARTAASRTSVFMSTPTCADRRRLQRFLPMTAATEPTRSAMWALAHPIRFRIWEVLREGPATASQLGRRLGESRGSMSYHLRTLASTGVIEEDAARGTRRERW